MSDYVWLCGARQDSKLIQFVDTDIAINDKKSAIEGQILNEKGLPVPPELCPKKIWGDGRAPKFKKMPNLFWAMSQWVVSEHAADILRQFNLGGGALYSISEGVYQNDQVTR